MKLLPTVTDLLPSWRFWYANLRQNIYTYAGADRGGIDESHEGWAGGRLTAYNLSKFLAFRASPGLLDAPVKEMDELARLMADFLVRRISSRWGIDLNGFYSPNEVGFTMPGLARAYMGITALPQNPLADVADQIKTYLLTGAEAVLVGEAYTANHRWAAAAGALAAVHAIWPDERYKEKFDSYLADGFDIDDDGCWDQERSSNYNIVANAGIIHLADALNRPDWLKLVQRNLDFVIHFLQPNGEMDTSFSHRQDRGVANRAACSLTQALRIARMTGDGRYSTLALHAWSKGDRGLDDLAPAFSMWEGKPKWPEPVPLSANYERQFHSSQLARRRSRKLAITLSADSGNHFFDTVAQGWGGPRRSDDWLHLHWGGIVVQSLHLAGAGMCNMQPHGLDQISPGRYRLHGEIPGWTHTLHFRPGSPQVKMPWHWKYEAEIGIGEDEVAVRLRSSSPISLIASLIFWIRPGVEVFEAGEPLGKLKAGDRLALKGGNDVRLALGEEYLDIRGLPAAGHRRFVMHAPSIPSGMATECGAVYLGVRFPVDLDFGIFGGGKHRMASVPIAPYVYQEVMAKG